MLPDLSSLQGMFSSFIVGSPQITPGQPTNFKLSPSDLSNIKLPSIVAANLNLTWLSKDVLFNNPLLEPVFTGDDPNLPFNVDNINGIIQGALPIRLPLPQLAALTLGIEELQGVTKGLISQLQGTLPVLVDLQVSVSVEWEVFETIDSTTPLVEGVDFIPLSGLDSLDLSLLFVPVLQELTTADPTSAIFTERFVQASVTLTAGVEIFPFTLPRIKVLVPAISLPRLVAFFRHADFKSEEGRQDGAVLIVVPNTSPIRNFDQLLEIVNIIDPILSAFNGLIEQAGFILGIKELTNMISSQPNIVVKVADNEGSIQNFRDILLIDRLIGLRANDQVSSMFYIGLPDTGVQCYNDKELEAGKGVFTLKAGNLLFAKVNNLHSASPAFAPTNALLPSSDATLVVDEAPPGGVFNPKDFGDEISSFTFNPIAELRRRSG